MNTEWVAFLDDDDYFYPQHLEALANAAQDTGADMVYPWYDVDGGTDDAIDWDASYEGEGLEGMRKKSRYRTEHDQAKLTYKEGARPTLFVFRHPRRVDSSRSLRKTFTSVLRGSGDKELFTEVWQENFIGTQEGHEAVLLNAPRPGDEELLSDKYLQALEDAEVFDELAQAFVMVANKRGAGDKAEVRSKK